MSLSAEQNTISVHKNGVFLVFLAGVLWSTMGLGIRLIEEASVWQIILYRSASLSLFLYIVILFRSKQHPFSLIYQSGWPVVAAAFSLVAAYSGGVYAIQTTSVANAMLLFATAPFMAAILGRILLNETIRKVTILACLIALTGVCIMVADKLAGSQIAGNLAALGSALGFASFTVSLRWGKSVEMLPAVFLSGIFAVLISLAICLATGLNLSLSIQDSSISLSMGIFQVGTGLILYTIGSRSLPAAELTLLSLAEVVLAPLWVWIFLGETVTNNTLVGGAVLLVAIAGNAMTGARRKPPPLTGP